MATVTKQKKNIPKLRFPDFSDEWCDAPVGEFTTLMSGNAFSSELFASAGKKLVTPKNFTKDGRGVFNENNTKYTTEDCDEKYICKAGDLLVLLTDLTPSCELLGKPMMLTKENGDVLLNQRIVKIWTDDRLSKEFLLYTFLTDKYHKRIKETATGTTVRHSSNSIIRNHIISLPSIPEQQKIAGFLGLVDDWLDNLRQQKAALETYKQGMMQKLFTQQVRFKDDNGKDFPEWTENEIGAFAEIYQPQTISQSVMDESAEYSVWGANGVVGRYKNYNHELPQVIVTCRGSTCGTVNMTGPNVWITGNAMVFNIDGNENVVKEFLYYNLKNDNLNYLISGSGQPQITGNIKHHKMMFPIRDEQQKIADFLTAIDETISAKAVEIAKVEQWKKGLMQKMFI